MACCVNPFHGTNKIGSVGMLVSDVKVKIVDSETSAHELPAGETGEIIMHAPRVMAGYWNNPGESSSVLRLCDDGSIWLFTGDLGHLGEDGYLFIVDRKVAGGRVVRERRQPAGRCVGCQPALRSH